MTEKRRTVFLGVPTRSPDIKVQMASSMVDEVYELGKADIATYPFFWSGDPLISHSRNVILAAFLFNTACDDLVWIDDDVSWERGSVVKLLSHSVDIVAGAYRHKTDNESYPVNWLPGVDGKIPIDPATKLVEVEGVPFGFTRITRSCAQRMYDAAADKPYVHRNAPDLKCRVVFDVEYHDGQYYGEDYVFCRKWKDLGGKVWLDPEMALNHTGHKVYEGHCGNWLRGDGGGQKDFRSMLKDVKAAIEEAA